MDQAPIGNESPYTVVDAKLEALAQAAPKRAGSFE